MKRLVAGLIAGLVIGTTGIATAAELSGWRTMAPGVKCKGGKNVVCYTTSDENLYGGAYSVYISDCSVAVWQDRNGSMRTVLERWQPSCR